MDIFFDLDHIFWDFDRNSALAFGRVFKKNKIPPVLSDFVREYEPINRDKREIADRGDKLFLTFYNLKSIYDHHGIFLDRSCGGDIFKPKF